MSARIAILVASLAISACVNPPSPASPSAIRNDAEFTACVVSGVVAKKTIGGILVDCGRDVPAIVAQVWELISSATLTKNPYSSTPAAAEVRTIRATVTAP